MFANTKKSTSISPKHTIAKIKSIDNLKIFKRERRSVSDYIFEEGIPGFNRIPTVLGECLNMYDNKHLTANVTIEVNN